MAIAICQELFPFITVNSIAYNAFPSVRGVIMCPIHIAHVCACGAWPICYVRIATGYSSIS